MFLFKRGWVTLKSGAQKEEGRLQPSQSFQCMKSTLYVVASPIGNLKDITLRALDILRSADVIAAEDTRVTAQLLRAYGIQAHLFSLREQNEAHAAQRVLSFLEEGKSVVQISDAGTPAVSDPGAFLCQFIRQHGFPIVPIPGSCALITALCVSGFTHPHFYFYGFLPPKAAQRQTVLTSLRTLQTMLIFYEAPHRIKATLEDCLNTFGEEHPAFLARELTKTYETLLHGTLGSIRERVLSDSMQQKGEFVLLLDAPKIIEQEVNVSALDKILKPLLAEVSLKKAVQIAGQMSDFSRNQLYERALYLTKKDEIPTNMGYK